MGMENFFVGCNDLKYLLIFKSTKITSPAYDGLFIHN